MVARGGGNDAAFDADWHSGNLASVRLEKRQEELMVRSLNFHGQQLTSFMKDHSEVMKGLDMKKIDYHLDQQVPRTCIKKVLELEIRNFPSYMCKV